MITEIGLVEDWGLKEFFVVGIYFFAYFFILRVLLCFMKDTHISKSQSMGMTQLRGRAYKYQKQ